MFSTKCLVSFLTLMHVPLNIDEVISDSALYIGLLSQTFNYTIFTIKIRCARNHHSLTIYSFCCLSPLGNDARGKRQDTLNHKNTCASNVTIAFSIIKTRNNLKYTRMIFLLFFLLIFGII